jgi:hypothetical protein
MSLAVWHKSALPRGWAYPIGVELLSEFLGTVPNAAAQPLRFSHAESYRLAERRRRQAEDSPLCILQARYSKFHVASEEPERPLWVLEVMSVPSSIRSWVKRGLVEQGLPRIRTWLLQSFPPTALESEPHCRVQLQEAQRRLLLEWRNSGFEPDSVEELPVSSSEE